MYKNVKNTIYIHLSFLPLSDLPAYTPAAQ